MEILWNIYGNAGIPDTELFKIAQKHCPISFSKGEYLLKEGEYSRAYYCIESGLLRTNVIDYNGQDITTGFIGNNQIAIDVLSLFNGLPAKENLQALSHVQAWRIEFGDFQELYHQIPAFNEWGRSWMSQELFHLKQKSIEMVTLSAKERYLRHVENFPQIIQNAPLKHIATYLGITDTSLSRIRKEISLGSN